MMYVHCKKCSEDGVQDKIAVRCETQKGHGQIICEAHDEPLLVSDCIVSLDPEDATG